MRNKLSKLIALLIMTVMCVSLFAPKVYAADLSLNKTKVSLEVSATIKLSLGKISAKKISWSSDKTKIATVSEYGTITAVKQGNATITATYNKTKYKCEVTVVDNNASSNPESLSQGTYVVGEDIIAGKYDLKALGGTGIIWIYSSLDAYEKDKYDSLETYALSGSEDVLKELDNMYTDTCKNMRLKSGYCIVVDSTLSIELIQK